MPHVHATPALRLCRWPHTEARPLLFGVVCHGVSLERWQAEALRHLIDTPDVHPAVIIDLGAAPPRARKGSLSSWVLRRLGGSPSDRRATRETDASELLADIPRLHCRVVNTDAGARIADADLEAIREHTLDFLLDFGSVPLGGAILGSAVHGLWAFRHGACDAGAAVPEFWSEIYRGDAVVEGTLERVADEGATVLRRGAIKTIDHSPDRSSDALLVASSRWPAQVCADIRNGTADYLSAAPVGNEKFGDGRPPHPSAARVAAILVRNACREVARQLFRQDHWRVGIIDAPIQSLLTKEHAKHGVRWLSAPGRSRFLADPFGVMRDGRLTILCESFDRRTALGSIVSVDASAGSASRPEPAAFLSDVHLSYPFLVEHGGEIYCIPETKQMREVALYRAIDFPRRWEKSAVLVPDRIAADATVFCYENRWWMAFVDGERGRNCDLHLWYASDLRGPWRPHTGNPVKTDVRSARPAGTPFIADGQLYRPAQDCSRTYGGRIVFNHVQRLTPNVFQERPAAFLEPTDLGPSFRGVHTVSAVGPITLVDAKETRFVPGALLQSIRKLLTSRSLGEIREP